MTLYEILGVGLSATKMQIKAAYKSLAQKQHPDKGGDPEKFAKIQHAYDVLKNDSSRKRYNLTGEDTVPNSQESQALATLVQFISQAIDAHVNAMGFHNNRNTTLLKTVRDSLANTINQGTTAQTNEASKVESLNSLLSKVTHKGENLFNSSIQSKIEVSEHKLAEIKNQLEIVVAALAMLEGYTEEEVMQIGTGTRSATFTGTHFDWRAT